MILRLQSNYLSEVTNSINTAIETENLNLHSKFTQPLFDKSIFKKVDVIFYGNVQSRELR
jgi:hypothetical protein